MVIYLNEFMQPIRERELEPLTEASFSFLPKWKVDPELKKYVSDIEKAKQLLKKDIKDPVKADVERALAMVLMNLAISAELCAGGFVSMNIINKCKPVWIVGAYLFDRFCAWGLKAGCEALVKKEAKKIIAKYNQLIQQATNEELKNQLISHRDRLVEGLEKKYDVTV